MLKYKKIGLIVVFLMAGLIACNNGAESVPSLTTPKLPRKPAEFIQILSDIKKMYIYLVR
jgi:hypothetical protein